MKRRLLIALALILVITAGCAWLLGSEGGNRRLLQWTLGDTLRIGHFQGSLLGAMELRDVTYAQAQQKLVIRRLQLHWRPMALFQGMLHLRQLQAAGIHHIDLESAEPAATATPFRLPVALRLDRVELEEIRLQSRDESREIRRIALRAETENNRIALSRLQIGYGGIDAEAEGDLTLDSNYPFELQVRWQGDVPKIGPSSGAGRIRGDIDAVDLEHETLTPFKLTTNGRIEFAPGAVRLQLEGEWQRLEWPLQAAAIKSAGGHYRLQGPLDTPRLQAEAQLLFPDTGTPPLTAQLDTRLSAIGLQDLTLTAQESRGPPHPAMALAVTGRIRLDGTAPDLDLSGDLTRARWPLLSDAFITSPQMRFHLKGPLQQPLFDARAKLEFPDNEVPGMEARLRTVFSATGLRDATLDARLLGGEARAGGYLEWSPELAWDLALTGNALDPSRHWSGWPGALALDGTLRGGMKKESLWLDADLKRLTGILHNQPINAAGKGGYDQDGFRFQPLRLQSGQNRLHLQGRFGDRLDLQYELKAPDLAAFWPELKGHIEAGGRLGGLRSAPELTATLKAGGLSYAEQGVQQIDARLTWGQDLVTGRLTANGISSGSLEGERLTLTLDGTPTAHQAQWVLVMPDLRLDADLRGGWQAGRWLGHLDQLVIEQHQLGRWTTEEPADVTAGSQQFSLGRACLLQNSTRLCAEAEWNPEISRIDAELTALPLARIMPWLPPDIRVDGSLDGKLQLAGALNAPRGVLQADLRQGLIQMELAGEEHLRLDVNSGAFRLQMTEEESRASMHLKAAGGEISAHARSAPLDRKGPIPLSGRLDAHLPDLQPLSLLTPGLSDLRGRLDATAELTGTLGQPRIEGRVELSEGAAGVPQLGLALEGIKLTATNQGMERIRLEGGLASGGGTLSIRGDLLLDAEQGWPLLLELQGQSFQVVRLPEAVAYVSPDLRIESRRNQLDVRGSLGLPRMEIKLKELPRGAVAVSPDETIVGRDEAVPTTPALAVDADVSVQLGDRVRFNGFGLNTRLTGKIDLNRREGRNIALGELTLREGRYKAYGQNLTIEQGSLLFNGPPENPNLNVRATRLSKDRTVTAILDIKGRLQQPQVQVSSNPELPEEEALSYLVTGRGLAEEGAGTAAILHQAAAVKGLEKSQEILDRYTGGLGIDEVRLKEGDAPEETALLLGKYLSPDLYISYAVGLFDNSGTFITRYRLSEKLHLEAQSGEQQSMDLIYHVER